MVVTITQRIAQTYQTNFKFPIFRSHTIDEDHKVYYKFENFHKVTIIEDCSGKMSITSYEDQNADFVNQYVTSEDMLFGRYQYDVIPEKIFDNAMQRLIDVIHRS